MGRERDTRSFDPDAMWRPPTDASEESTAPEPVEFLEPVRHQDRRVVAFVTLPGLITEEHDIFRTVLGHLPGIEPVNVGHRVGPVAGPGGERFVEAVFADITDPDIVVIPGGLGSRESARDPALRSWLREVAPRCRWITSSSTGSVVLAAAGLLKGHPAATHWLAGELLAEFGSDIAGERVYVDAERVVTATGSATAFEAAYLVIERELGAEEAARIRREVGTVEQDVPEPRQPRWRRLRRRAPGTDR